ncbi:MAG: CHAD domain-containing protein [Xanthobacteraceae bacterium]
MHGTAPVPHQEIEIKLELAPANVPDLKKIPFLRAVKPAPKSATQVSVYFDTDSQKLRKKGLILRVRREGRRHTQTIKATAHAGDFERDEWEAEIAGNEPDLDQVSGTALEPLLTKKLRRRLKPVFETRVRRTVYPLVDDAHAIALTLDQGTIDTGTRSQSLCEIELELKRGSTADLFDVARELTHALPARLAVKSKSERGYEILDGQQEVPVKAAAIDLRAGVSAREAFKTVGLACLKQAIDNEPALLRGDPEGVHQMRVGLRRLRAAMSLFAALLRDPQTTAIKSELKWLAGELGPARELEVLVNRVVAPMKRRRRRWRGMPSLSHEFAERRDAALSRAQAAVRSARFRALTLDVAVWLEAGLWTNPPDDLVRDRGDQPIETFAFEQLARRWRKVRKKGRMLARLDERRRHKLRIQTKKLRYAAEFFATLFTTKRALKRRKQFLPALERLQNGLGDLNDIAVHEKRIAAVGARRRRSNPSRVFAAGLLTGREDARTDAAMTAATEAYADLAKVKPFWR